MCDSTVKGLLAKVWKDEEIDLAPGTHYVDEVLTIHVSGSVQRQNDAMVAPTTSLPLIPILALFWEKSGIARDHALRMLREAITEAMEQGKTKGERIEARIKDVETSVKAVKDDLISKLPKQRRSGRLITKDLQITVLSEQARTTAAA